jgi:carbon monoxide dehydrogenase subunit G
MKLEQSFEVSAPLQRVWEALIDVERVAPCLPGATVTGRNDDGSYNGEFKVKIGPTSAAYSGKLNMDSVDEDTHRATMQAAGTDKRGQGGAKASIESSVQEVDADTTTVNVSTDYHITGRLARFGRGGMIEEISNRLLREFAKNLQTMVAGDGKGAAESAETAAVDDAATADATGATTGATAAAGDGTAATAETGDGTAATEVGDAATATATATTEGDAADGAATGAAEPDASSAEIDAAADEPPVPQAGSQGEPGDPAHAPEATHEANAAAPARNAGADPDDDPFAPPVAAPPPSGTAAGNAPPPPSTPTTPPLEENKPLQGLPLIGGALLSQAKRKSIPIAGVLAAILVVLSLLRRRRGR